MAARIAPADAVLHVPPALTRIWALRVNLTAYDAAYVALAEGLGATLLTTDQRLARAVHRAQVELPP